MSTAAARAHQQLQEQHADGAAAEAARLWGRVDPSNIQASWAAQVPRATTVLSAAQLAAALGAVEYLDELMGIAAPPTAPINPASLAGVASDGRDLWTLLLQPGIGTLDRIQHGETPTRAMAWGQWQLDTIARTQTADAARASEQLGMAVRPRVVAYTRVVEASACARCMILAGQEYAWSEGFLRHPQCVCTMRPMRPGERITGDSPKAAFDSLSRAEQDRRFGEHAAEAIRAGADMSQVVNARRGMDTAQGRYTTEGTTRRGYAGQRLGNLTDRSGRYVRSGTPRLMPDAIIRDASDRDHAMRLLYEHGYLATQP